MTSTINYLTVYNAHSGQQAKIPKPVRFLTLQKLKIHLQESFTDDIIGSIDNIFLLTPFGIKLDFAMINEMSELYLYDRRLFQKPAEKQLISRYLKQDDSRSETLVKPEKFLFLSVNRNLHQSYTIKELLESLKNYEKWTVYLQTSLRQMGEKIDVLKRQINAIFKALNVIFLFSSNFVGSAEKSFRSEFNYVKLIAMKSLNKSWKSHFTSLEEFPTFRFKDGRLVRLGDLLDQQSLSHAAKYVSEHLPKVVLQFNALSLAINKVNDQKISVDTFIEQHRRNSVEKFENFESERSVLGTEIDLLLAKVAADMLVLDTAPSDDLHKYYTKHSEISTKLFEKAEAMYAYLETFREFKVKLAQDCPEVFENIAVQQMKCVEVKNTCKKLLGGAENPGNHSEELGVFSRIKGYEDLLSATVDLPLLFGFVLTEKRRQFEWHDFYAKGIVANVSEQLTVIIENEKVFQKLWNKKFGKLIKLINPTAGMHVHVPAIDVTLVNSGPNLSEDSLLNWLGDSVVEREDVLNYIASVRSHKFVNNDKFADLLERNFKDLVGSTEKLKKITKTVASLGSSSALESMTQLKLQLVRKENFRGVDGDKDLNLIKGLKSRIKKLEDLLHQQQFKNLTDWPVVKASYGHPRDNDNLASLLIQPSKPSASTTNPINLLPKSVSLRKLSQDLGTDLSSCKVLDASTTIDKHLDNIRLRKELADLRASNSKLAYEKETLLKEIAMLHQTREEEQRQNEKVRSKLERSVIDSKAVIEKKTLEHDQAITILQRQHEAEIHALNEVRVGLEKDLEAKTLTNSRLETEVLELRTRLAAVLSQTVKENEKLQDELKSMKAKLSDLQIMNAELLSNMQAKETEFSTERSDTESRIKGLEYKLEEKTEDFEALMEMSQARLRSMEELLSHTNKSLAALFDAVGMLLVSNVKYFHELCVILESMGLLLVREPNSETNVHEFRIRRVKGLRAKKDIDDSRPHLERTQSTAVQEVTRSFAWIGEFTEQQKLTINAADETFTSTEEESTYDAETREAETQRLLEKCDQYVMPGDGGTASKVADFVHLVSFEQHVQLQTHDDGRDTSHERFFLNGIIKRFNDVEGFAKKLTRENKAKHAELVRVLKHAAGKLAVRDFQAGDLVLFLPTRIERFGSGSGPEKGSESKNELDADIVTPWTAFNIDAPHYFLDASLRANGMSTEEWVVSRVSAVSAHEVTETNVHDAAANPFALSVGITWYMLATEV